MLEVEKIENTMTLDRSRFGMSKGSKETRVAGTKGGKDERWG